MERRGERREQFCWLLIDGPCKGRRLLFYSDEETWRKTIHAREGTDHEYQSTYFTAHGLTYRLGAINLVSDRREIERVINEHNHRPCQMVERELVVKAVYTNRVEEPSVKMEDEEGTFCLEVPANLDVKSWFDEGETEIFIRIIAKVVDDDLTLNILQKLPPKQW